jgi:hypothetical protein
VLGPLAKPSPKREGGYEPGAGSFLISHDHALHNPASPSTTPTCTFSGAPGPRSSEVILAPLEAIYAGPWMQTSENTPSTHFSEFREHLF